MNLKLETEFSKAEMLTEVDDLKRRIEDLRPFPNDVEGKVMQKLRLDWNYHSNAIEGNRLSYGETVAFLMEGITAKGKPLKDHLDIRGHNEAINFLLSIVKDTRVISEADIRNLHQMILVEPYDVKAQTADGLPTTKRINLGEYKTSANHVQTATGETHYYATPEETPAKMQELMEWYYEVSQNVEIHPVVVAALFHHKFVAIHPFDDGNGRLSRILMNLILMRKGFPPVVIKNDDRQNYYSLLSRADSGEGWPFVEYIIERLERSLQLYLTALRGEDIDEDEDIDKEIFFVQMQLNKGLIAKERKSKEIVKSVFIDNIFPLFLKISLKSRVFEKYFFKNGHWLCFSIKSGETTSNKFEHLREDGLDIYSNYFDNNEDMQVQLEVEFIKYRNPENDFDISIYVNVEFDSYYYKILLNEEVLISKLYHETLLKEEQSIFLKKFIQTFKNIITDKQKAQDSINPRP